MTDLEMRRPAARGVAVCRLLPVVPAMVGSAAMMLVLFGWAGEWTGVLLLGWILAGVALTSRIGEPLVVWWYRGYRPTLAQWEAIDGPWRAALHRCDLDPHRFDVYVREGRDPNAYSLGRRSIVVTVGLLELLLTGCLTPAMVAAVFVHELGHRASGATRCSFAVRWWSAPWRLASRFVLGLTFGLMGRRRPPRLLACVVITGAVVAIVQSAEQHEWVVAAVLIALPALGTSVPLLDAAISRRCERVADDYAATAGAGYELSNALSAMRAEQRSAGVLKRLKAHHPDPGERIEMLRTVSV